MADLTMSWGRPTLLSVRDDIHKQAPVPPRWKALIKACNRDTPGWELESQLAGEAASIFEARSFRTELIGELTEQLNQPQQVLLVTQEDLDKVSKGRQLLPEEQLLMRHLAVFVAHIPSSRNPLEQALSHSLAARIQARLREIDGFLCSKYRGERQKLMARLRQVMTQQSLSSYVQKILSGGPLQFPKKVRKALDLDMDLRG